MNFFDFMIGFIVGVGVSVFFYGMINLSYRMKKDREELEK